MSARRSSATRGLRAGALLLGALVLAAVAAPWLATSDPLETRPAKIYAPPSTEHVFGTDGLGRDVLARALHGARRSLTAGGVATLIAFSIGAVAGGVAGYRGGVVDVVLSRVCDTVWAFPSLVGALAVLGLLAAHLETVPPALRVGLVIGAFGWPALFRFVRAEMQRLAEGDVTLGARATGASPARVVFRHLLPAALVPALAPASFLAAGAILSEAMLGFLGLGIVTPTPSWGTLLREALLGWRGAWWLAVFPGVLLYATTLALQLLGEGLRRRFGGPESAR